VVIGVDVDGVITPARLWNPSLRLPLPWWFFIILIPLVFISKPKKKIVEELRNAQKEGWAIIVISARPKQVEGLTKIYLRFYKIPFAKVTCVGFGKGTGKRKFEAAKRENVVIFVDDSGNIVSFFLENGVRATNTLKGATCLGEVAPFRLKNLRNNDIYYNNGYLVQW